MKLLTLLSSVSIGLAAANIAPSGFYSTIKPGFTTAHGPVVSSGNIPLPEFFDTYKPGFTTGHGPLATSKPTIPMVSPNTTSVKISAPPISTVNSGVIGTTGNPDAHTRTRRNVESSSSYTYTHNRCSG
jgi:hypothetical protein